MSGSDKTKGNAGRLITVPGYHIHPQYDLVHTRHLIHERRHKKANFHLNLAPMVDMFSILVIYLIMNFSSSGEAFFISKEITIPKATQGRPMESFPLLSVVKGTVMFETESEPGKNGIYVEELNDGQVPKLRETLRKIREVQQAISGDKTFKGHVNIQADEATPIEDVKKVMRVLIDEGWNGLNFIVDPSKKK